MMENLRAVDFLGPLALRLYLVPIMWAAGKSKFQNWDSNVEWFGNAEWGLGLPMPELMVFMSASAEAGGAILLLLGLGVRWASIPLMVTMVVAAVTTHLEAGWATIASSYESSDRLNAAKALLREHGDYEWLTATGEFVILNDGIEFAATYFIMLLALLFMGGGRYVSADYWITKKFRNN